MTVQGLREHRPDVLADLLALFGREIQTVAYLIVRDPGDAEEILAETLLSALEHGHQLRDETALRAWLLRIAANQALGMRRRSGRLIQLDSLPESGSPIAMDTAALDRAVLKDALASLPPRVRAAIALRYYADLNVDEVAAALGTSRNTVKTQLRIGLDRLRDHLRDRSLEAAALGTEANHV
ncbi:MAG: RNA polymerase sigma factor [Candidatus Limnocylindrales bacterium]